MRTRSTTHINIGCQSPKKVPDSPPGANQGIRDISVHLIPLLGFPLAGVAASLLHAQSAVPKPGRLEVRVGRGGEVFANLPGVAPYTAFIFFSMAGFANFPLISFHMKARSITPDTTMVISVTVTALLAFSLTPSLVIAGSLAWGAGIGLSETVVRASIAESTALEYRGEAYGILSAAFGATWFIGSVVMGILYEVSLAHIVAYVVIVEIVAVATYLWIYRARIATWVRKEARDLVP